MKKRQIIFRVAAIALMLGGGPAGSSQVGSNQFVLAGEPPFQALLVVNKAENSLVIFDPQSLQPIARVPTGEQPHEVTVSSDGRFAYVANYGTDEGPGRTISVIDIVERKEVKRVELGALTRPHGITQAGGKVYFTVEGNHAVGRYDHCANRIDWLIGTGQMKTHMVVVTPDSKKIYAANGASGTVTVIEQDETIGIVKIAQIAVGSAPEGIDLSPDGRQLWVAHLGDGGLSIIDVATDKVKRVIKAGKTPIRVKFSPDGRRVLVTDLQGGEVIIFDPVTGKEINRVEVGVVPVGILVQPDSRRAFISLPATGQIAVLDLERLTLAGKIRAGAGPDGMAWAGGISGRGKEALLK
jgi:YVTN family beta-propeller protein